MCADDKRTRSPSWKVRGCLFWFAYFSWLAFTRARESLATFVAFWMVSKNSVATGTVSWSLDMPCAGVQGCLPYTTKKVVSLVEALTALLHVNSAEGRS